MEKLKYQNYARCPENFNVLERYLIKIIENQNEIIDWIKNHEIEKE